MEWSPVRRVPLPDRALIRFTSLAAFRVLGTLDLFGPCDPQSLEADGNARDFGEVVRPSVLWP